jgi:hypothetical protein
VNYYLTHKVTTIKEYLCIILRGKDLQIIEVGFIKINISEKRIESFVEYN